MTQEVESSMFKWKTIAAFAFAATIGASAYAANPFSDVPRTHWAYESIQKAVDAGILQGYEGKFHGDKLVNRYQMAVIVKKILDTVGSKGGATGAGMKPDDIKNLEQLTIEFADELALLNTKVSTLEDSFVQLRGEVDKLKGGSGAGATGGGLTNAFTGMVSVALLNTDDGAGTTPPVGGFGGPVRTRYAGAPDQTFFSIPQASIALDKEVGEGIGLHVQYDYGTNGLGVGAALDGTSQGAAVGLNEAYLLVDEIFGDIGAKIGGFALPFQSWEVNGPFRTCNYTITPSVINTAFEVSRVVGLEISKMKDVDPADFQWRLGIFNGSDVALGGSAAAGGIGFQNDIAGMAGLTNSATFDDSFGFYLDLESGNDPDRNWGWRLGFFDMGGDNGNVGPGPAASDEIDGFNVGFWWKNDDFRVMLQYLNANAESGVIGGATDIDSDAWYILINYQMNEDSSLSLRYDDWENENNVPGITGGSEGDSFTFAYNRKTSDTSMFQFEWISPDEDALNVPGSGDIDDDLVQLRYKVWF
jgi:hypothetical protein